MAGFTQANLRADFAEMQNDIAAQSLTWSGTAYDAIIQEVETGYEIEVAGKLRSVSFVAVVNLADFSGSTPDHPDKVTIGGVEYRVVSTMPDPLDATLHISIGPETG